ncbi:hypothetical protein ACS0OT_07155 [Stenotrophomonas maltophilia group sp. RY12688]|uniref:hypothetical protein n=1 Tax=Stenotrophomonas maltophilia group sp. RY12688 TaxID=3454438 RepID=UPI003F9A0EFD
MERIKRYHWNGDQSRTGELVLHSDHEAELARLRADLEGYMMGAVAEAREVDARGEEIKRLRAELQNAAKAALDAVALACEKEREADALRVKAERYDWIRRNAVLDGANGDQFDSEIDEAMGADA